MNIPCLIGAVVMFVMCFLVKKFLHVFGLPLIMILGLIGFILLMVGLFKSKFTNVQQQPIVPIVPNKEEEKQE